MEEKNKKINKLKITTILLIVICALFVIGLTSYAVFNMNLSGINNIIAKVPNISLTYEEPPEALEISGASYTIDEGKVLNDYFEFTITGTSSITYDMPYLIYLTEETTNTFNKENIYLYLTEIIDSSEVAVVEPVKLFDLSSYVNKDNSLIISSDVFYFTEEIDEISRTYRLRLWPNYSGDFTTEDAEVITNEDGSQSVIIEGGVFEWTVNVDTIEPPINLYDLVASQSLGTDTENNISYSAISSDTNGLGVYTINGTASDEYPVYFYRGAVTNNNVVFGKYCWKIVRTTSTGGVKLIYNGEYTEDNKCNNTGTASQLAAQSIFNLDSGAAYSVGYYYDTSDTLETTNNGTALNTTPSTIATTVNTWYGSEESGMTELTYMLENEKWCNDRTNDGEYFGAYTRLRVNYQPSIECPNNNDAFTLSVEAGGVEGYGNNVLDYPVGLITADEVTYAGGHNATNNTYYLNTGQNYWTSSPFFFDGEDARCFMIGSNGYVSRLDVFLGYGVRPSVSLKQGTTVEDGADGTVSDPYIVVLE